MKINKGNKISLFNNLEKKNYIFILFIINTLFDLKYIFLFK